MNRHKTVVSDIMRKVVTMEKSRTTSFWQRYRIYILVTCLVCAVAFVFILRQASEFGTFALFELFGEDTEVISLYWRDIVDTVLIEIEPVWWGLLALTMVLFISGVFVTRRTRARLRRVSGELRTLERKERV